MKTDRADVIAAYRLFLNREPENESLIDYWKVNASTTADLRSKFMASPEYIRDNPVADLMNAAIQSRERYEELASFVPEIYISFIHLARLKLIEKLVPAGDVILDLGGAHSPLHEMGYPHHYSKMTLVDLPMEDRHEFHQVEVADAGGRVFILYEDMTSLKSIESASIDLVWSGQTIEHVSPELGKRMCREVFRVLKPGGRFCLDTPNRLITRLHTEPTGGGFIFPDHAVEYTPDQLRALLAEAGFEIVDEWGLCEMPFSAYEGIFRYSDFLVGGLLTRNIEDSYMQYFHCEKPTT